MVRATSKAAHNDNEQTGKNADRVSMILHAVRDGGEYTLREISEATGLELGNVSGRVNKMKSDDPDYGLGYLEECEPKKCSVTGRTVTPVRLRAKMMLRELAF